MALKSLHILAPVTLPSLLITTPLLSRSSSRSVNPLPRARMVSYKSRHAMALPRILPRRVILRISSQLLSLNSKTLLDLTLYSL